MEKEIFGFIDDHFKSETVQKNKLIKKLKYSFKYLEQYVPTNEVTESFSFSDLKKYEGKNYDWFFLVQDNIKMLVRQYSTHFTFILCSKIEDFEYLGKKIYSYEYSVFSIADDFGKMGELNDDYVDNNFLTLEQILPSLFEIAKKDKIHTIWNPLSLVRPKFTDVKIAQIGETTHSLDLLIFALDEVFHLHSQYFAENEMANKISDFKVGDMLGDVYKITEVKKEIDKEYYYNTGLSFINTNFPNEKSKWSDVYCLTRYYLEYIFPPIKNI